MSFITEQVSREHATHLLPILLDAEEGEERIRVTLSDPDCIAYAGWLGNELAGAAVVYGQSNDTEEILYIAVRSDLRGQGYGKMIIQHLKEELGRRHRHVLLVGTANSSLENIAFYQKCGFRMFEVRRDYFSYIQPPISEHGIVMRDMLVFRYDLE